MSNLSMIPSLLILLSNVLYFFVANVQNVTVKILCSTSIQVSWSIIEIVEVTNFTVYYREVETNEEIMVTVPSSVSLVIISLVTDRQYTIEVSAISVVNGISVTEKRTSYGPLTLSTGYSCYLQGSPSMCFNVA